MACCINFGLKTSEKKLCAYVQALILTLALAALTGCVGVKPGLQPQPAMPPLPPGAEPAKKVTVLRSPRAKAAMSAQVMSFSPPPEPEVWVENKLYITKDTNGVFLHWLRPDNTKHVLLASTNISEETIRWESLSTHCKTIVNGVASIQVTNLSYPQRFFRLVTVPTNSIVFGWTYPFEKEPTVVGFRLYQGPSSGVYNASTNIDGRRIWSVQPWPGSTNRVFYTLTAHDGNGLESDNSNEVNFAPGDPFPGPYTPPCP